MKIDANQISPGGLILEEEIPANVLDLDNDKIFFTGPIHARADISRITNAITVKLRLDAKIKSVCSRCVREFQEDYSRQFLFNYRFDPKEPVINLDTDIREEILLELPINPLCKKDCKGICAHCGEDLNQRPCSCNIGPK